jgi:hypothetical protein
MRADILAHNFIIGAPSLENDFIFRPLGRHALPLNQDGNYGASF